MPANLRQLAFAKKERSCGLAELCMVSPTHRTSDELKVFLFNVLKRTKKMRELPSHMTMLSPSGDVPRGAATRGESFLCFLRRVTERREARSFFFVNNSRLLVCAAGNSTHPPPPPRLLLFVLFSLHICVFPCVAADACAADAVYVRLPSPMGLSAIQSSAPH
jgi:hypothetical protein